MNDAFPFMTVLVEDENCNVETVPYGQCDNLFEPLEHRYSNYSPKISYVWVKLPIRRDIPFTIVFDIEEPTLTYVALFNWVDDSLHTTVITDLTPMSQRTVKSLEPVFGVAPELGVETTVYLRLRITIPKRFPISIGTPQAFLHSMQLKYLWNGLYFGAMLIMGFYNLFIWFSVRDRAWLYYSFFVFSFALSMSYARGFAFLYFWPETPVISTYPNVITGWTFIMGTAFSARFLNLKEMDRSMYRVGQVVIGTLLALMVFSLFGYRFYGIMATQITVGFGSAFLMYVGYRSYKRGYRPARFYITGWTILLFCALFLVLGIQGILPRGTFSVTILQIGSVFEMLLLSYALADRINTYRAESQSLQALNDLKTRLFSVVSHDVRYPLASLTMLLDLHESGDLTPEERDSLLADIRRSLNTSNEMLNGLLQWSSSQMRSNQNEAEHIAMQEFVDEHVRQIQPLIKKKSLELKISIEPADASPRLDRGLASLAMRNLLTNAVKFTPHGGKVDVAVREGNTHVHITVTDTGVGMNAESVAMLFADKARPASLGTDREPGAGVGLLLLRHMLDASGGALHVSSELGKGSQFTVDLRKGRI